jgi:cytoskeletal protein RodZ
VTEPTNPSTMGAYLRAARRRRRVSIERAAEDTKIRATFLMRMESDEFDFLAPAYVRGFLKTYARFLRVDPEPLLKEFDSKFGAERVDSAQIVALQRRSRSVPKQRRRLNSWAVAAAGAVILLGILSVIGLASNSGPQPQPGVALNQRSATSSASATTRPSTSPTPSPSATPSSAAVAFANGIAAKVTAVRAACWLYVTDQTGSLLYSGTLSVGQAQKLQASKEMTIIFGNAPGVDVVVNGRDLGAPYASPGRYVLHIPQDVKKLF